jgi:hypothetical protein
LLIGGERGQDALDDAFLLEAGGAALARQVDLGHPADGQLAQQQILAEGARVAIRFVHGLQSLIRQG